MGQPYLLSWNLNKKIFPTLEQKRRVLEHDQERSNNNYNHPVGLLGKLKAKVNQQIHTIP